MLQLQKGQGAGASTIIRETVRQYGLLGMYRGFSVVLVGNVPKASELFIARLFHREPFHRNFFVS